MGGKPKTTTPADQRLKRNNPNAGNRAAKPAPAKIIPPRAPKRTKGAS